MTPALLLTPALTFADSVQHHYAERDVSALKEPEYTEVQPNGRIKHWIYVEELGKYFRVVTEPDGETLITAFPDRSFKPEEH